MAKESDARIERLKKAHQDTQGQMVEMMEMLRTLVKDKGQATGSGQQSSAAHPDQKREKYVYLLGFTPRIHKRSPCLK